ncbi:MAG: YwbE family protein [Nitrosopumilus sp.]
MVTNSPPSRDKLGVGLKVQIIQKQDQPTGNLTEGKIKQILTSSNIHPHGIKVKLSSGEIGRVQTIV